MSSESYEATHHLNYTRMYKLMVLKVWKSHLITFIWFLYEINNITHIKYTYIWITHDKAVQVHVDIKSKSLLMTTQYRSGTYVLVGQEG